MKKFEFLDISRDISHAKPIELNKEERRSRR